MDERRNTTEKFKNVTDTITRLLDGYDIRLRPSFGGKTSQSQGSRREN